MSSFKKPNRKFRQRARDEDSDEEKLHVKREEPAEDKSQSPTPENVPDEYDEMYAESKRMTAEAKAKLSFHDDDDENEVFKVKKSSYSRRIGKQIEKARRQETKEERSKQRETTKKNLESSSESVRKRMEREKKEKDQEELNVIWVKSEVVKPAPEVIEIPAEDPFSDNTDDEEDSAHPFRGALERGVIPDARTIYELKKKRQQARDADDFIPLTSNAKKEEKYKEPATGEEGEDDDEDEDDDRIEFTVDKEAKERERTREAFYEAQGEDDEGEEDQNSDNELQRWEREQIRKGLGAQKNPNTHGSTFATDMIMEDSSSPRESSENAAQSRSTIPAHISRPTTIINPRELCNQLRKKLDEKRENLESLERQLVHLGIESMQAEDSISEQEANAKQSGREFEFYQIMSGYVGSQLKK